MQVAGGAVLQIGRGMGRDAFVEHGLVIEAGQHRDRGGSVEPDPVELDGEDRAERRERLQARGGGGGVGMGGNGDRVTFQSVWLPWCW